MEYRRNERPEVELEEEYNRKLFEVVKLVRSTLEEIIKSDEFEPCRLLAPRAISQVCEWIFKHISENLDYGSSDTDSDSGSGEKE